MNSKHKGDKVRIGVVGVGRMGPPWLGGAASAGNASATTMIATSASASMIRLVVVCLFRCIQVFLQICSLDHG